MAYMIQHLDTIANTARIAVDLAGMSKEDALTRALDSIDDTVHGIVSTRDRRGEWSEERVEEYRELGGVARDVRNGFVSPSIGNVRDYVLGRI